MASYPKPTIYNIFNPIDYPTTDSDYISESELLAQLANYVLNSTLTSTLADYTTLSTAQVISGIKTFSDNTISKTLETTGQSNNTSRTILKLLSGISGLYARIGQFSTGAPSQFAITNNCNRDASSSVVKDNVSYGSNFFAFGADGSLSFQSWNTSGDTGLIVGLAIDSLRNCFTRNLYIGSSSQASLTTSNTYPLLKDIKNGGTVSGCNQLGTTVTSIAYPNVNMTSNNTSSYVSSSNTNNSDAWKAFDGATNTSWATTYFYNPYYTGANSTYTDNKYSILGDYLQINFPFYITPYSFTITFPSPMPTYYPRVISLVASKDGSNWIYLCKNTNIFSTTTTNISIYQGNFIYFRFIIEQLNTAILGLNGGIIPEIRINGVRYDNYLTYLPNSVEIGNSIYNASSIDTDYILNVNGDMRVNGNIISSGSGDVLCQRCYNSTGILANLTLAFNVFPSTDTTVATVNYTCKGLSSIISIFVDADYSCSAGGSGNDAIYSSITAYNDNQILITKTQQFNNAGGGGTRGNTIFPIMGVVKRPEGSANPLDIRVKCYKNSDDTWTLNSMNIVIIESNE